MPIGHPLVEWRKLPGLSMRELARRADVHPSRIRAYENGEEPGVRIAGRIAAALREAGTVTESFPPARFGEQPRIVIVEASEPRVEDTQRPL